MLVSSFDEFIDLTAKCPYCNNFVFSSKEIENQKLDCVFYFNSGPFSATLDFVSNKTHCSISNQKTSDYLLISCEKCNYCSYFIMEVKEASKILPQNIEKYSEYIEASNKRLFTNYFDKFTKLYYLNNKKEIIKKIDLKFKPIIDYADIFYQTKYDLLI